MDFQHSERAQDFIKTLERFMKERVLPAEHSYFDQLVGSADWTEWKIPPVSHTVWKPSFSFLHAFNTSDFSVTARAKSSGIP